MRSMWQMTLAKSQWVRSFYRTSCIPADVRVRRWRERQIARQRLELGPFATKSNIHSSVAVELTKGCSVGCWFCAFSPDKLSAAFAYTEEHRALWLDVLDALRVRLGPAAASIFLYWASDPFDNPDYERFCLDVHERLGVFPPTTTALALKDPARTRRFLELSQARGVWLNRFSVLSLKMLDRVHAEFTPAELAHVECLAVNKESSFSFGNAGRFRERALAQPELLAEQRRKVGFAPWFAADRAYDGVEAYPMDSISCVNGFLLNMVDRTVKLISPCVADDRRPLGYETYAERSFGDAAELGAALDDAIARHMTVGLADGVRVRFYPWVRYEECKGGFRVSGRFNEALEFVDDDHGDAWRLLGALVRGGETSAGVLGERIGADCNVGAERARTMLDVVFNAGLIDERDL